MTGLQAFRSRSSFLYAQEQALRKYAASSVNAGKIVHIALTI